MTREIKEACADGFIMAFGVIIAVNLTLGVSGGENLSPVSRSKEFLRPQSGFECGKRTSCTRLGGLWPTLDVPPQPYHSQSASGPSPPFDSRRPHFGRGHPVAPTGSGAPRFNLDGTALPANVDGGQWQLESADQARRMTGHRCSSNVSSVERCEMTACLSCLLCWSGGLLHGGGARPAFSRRQSIAPLASARSNGACFGDRVQDVAG